MEKSGEITDKLTELQVRPQFFSKLKGEICDGAFKLGPTTLNLCLVKTTSIFKIKPESSESSKEYQKIFCDYLS